jgi:hypothetical protein
MCRVSKSYRLLASDHELTENFPQVAESVASVLELVRWLRTGSQSVPILPALADFL